MKKRTLGVLCVTGCGAGLLVAGLSAEPPSWINTDPDKAMEAMMAAGTPGEPHEFLGQSIGDFDCTMRMWMDPSAPPMEFKASAKRYWKIEGKWVGEDFECPDMMGMGSFTGFGITGWSNVRKQFVSTWCDSMTTSLMTMHGSISADMKTMTLIGEMDEPMTGEIGKAVMAKTRIIDDDHSRFEMYEILYGEPFKVMEIEYTRKK